MGNAARFNSYCGFEKSTPLIITESGRKLGRDLGQEIIWRCFSRPSGQKLTAIEITVSKEEEERRESRNSLAGSIAQEIYVYADERVGHAEGVPRDELMLVTYHRLGELLAEWGKKLDKLQKVSEEPQWLKDYVRRKEASEGRAMVAYDFASLGFPVDGLFFAREKERNASLSDDLVLVSEPTSMLMEDFKFLVDFCEKYKLDFYVDGFNTRLPGRAFRMAIFRPKLSTKSQLEFREKSIAALKFFKELYSSKIAEGGSTTMIGKEAFVNELVKTGEFDELLARKIVEVLVSSGQIARSALN
jgi:hypothetical protein